MKTVVARRSARSASSAGSRTVGALRAARCTASGNLRGRPSLLTPAGTRQLEPGEAVHFPLGEEGAHQMLNPTDEEVRFLAVSTNGAPDIVVYPDSGKLSASERLPEGGGLHTFFDLDSQVGYWEGESAPE